MLTIKTKLDCTLGFALGWKGLDGRFAFQLNQDIEFPANVIGKLSEITEEQARELVENITSAGDLTVYKRYPHVYKGIELRPHCFKIDDEGKLTGEIKYVRAFILYTQQ